MKQRMIAGLLTAALALQTSAVLAFEAAPAPLPETGVVFYDNMDGYAAKDDLFFKNGGAYNNNQAVPKDFNGDIMAAVPARAGNVGTASGTAGATHYSLSIGNYWGYGEADIYTGKLKLEYQVYIPSGSTIASGEQHRIYVMTYSQAGWNNAGLKEQANISQVMCTAGNPVVTFCEKDVNQPHTDVSVEIGFDRKYTVTTIIDFDAATVGHYVDGELKATYKDDSSVSVRRAYKFGNLYFVTDGIVTQGGNPQIYYDDIKVERMGGAAVMSAAVSAVGDNYIDVKCSDTVGTTEFAADDYAANVVSEIEQVHPVRIEKVTADTIRFTFADNFRLSANYEFCINGAITGAYDKNVSIPAGTRLLFNTAVADGRVVLIDEDFDDMAFPTNQTESRNSNLGFRCTAGTNATAISDQKQYSYMYVQPRADAQGGKLLRFETTTEKYGANNEYNWYDWSGNVTQLEFPFADGKTVSDGILTVEFDAAVPEGHQRVDFSFGLSDAAAPQTTYSYANVWADADLYAGLTYWTDLQKSFTYAKDDKPARLWGGNASDWETGVIRQINNGNAMHKYKFVIDLDSKSYDIYFDGEKVQHLDYLPGSKQAVEYDAFVLARTTYEQPYAYRLDPIHIDNLKVTQSQPTPAMVQEVRFQKYDGIKYGYNHVLPAGLMGAEVKFSKEMRSADITVEGMEASEYEVTLNGDTAVVAFDDCLAANGAYAIAVGADSTDIDGRPIANAVRFSFVADGGEIAYLTPVIKYNGNVLDSPAELAADGALCAEVTAVNTTTGKTGAYVTLIAYKDGKIAYAAVQQYAPESGAPRLNTIVLEADNAAACVGADAIKAFVFDNLTEFRPLAGAGVVE